MIVYDTKYGELYDKNKETGQVSAVLRCYHDGTNVSFDRFNYADNGEYVKAIAKNLKEYQCTYYLEDGSRPLKCKDCERCYQKDECNHNQKYYEVK